MVVVDQSRPVIDVDQAAGLQGGDLLWSAAGVADQRLDGPIHPANVLGGPTKLGEVGVRAEPVQVASERANAAKGGDDAASWRPRRVGQCEFASDYITIKKPYELPVDRSEKCALTEMLQYC